MNWQRTLVCIAVLLWAGCTTEPATPSEPANDSTTSASDSATSQWRDTVLVEYQSIAQAGLAKGRHPVDGVNNTYRAIRTINPTTGVSLLYAEFTDVNITADWDFADGTIK